MYVSLVRRGEDPLQCDAERESQERLHVQVCLAATDVPYGTREQRSQVRWGGVAIARGAHHVTGRHGAARVGRRRLCDVRMRRQLRDRQRVRLLAAALAQGVAATDVNRHPTAEIGQREVDPAITAGLFADEEMSMDLAEVRPILDAEVARFGAILSEYRQAPEVTRRRLYLEMVGDVLPRAGQLLVVQRGGQDPLPLLNVAGAAGRTVPSRGEP